MTDILKYRSVSINHQTYSKLEKLSKTVTPGIRLSISKTIEALVSDRIVNPHKQGVINDNT
jgi:dUTPase